MSARAHTEPEPEDYYVIADTRERVVAAVPMPDIRLVAAVAGGTVEEAQASLGRLKAAGALWFDERVPDVLLFTTTAEDEQ